MRGIFNAKSALAKVLNITVARLVFTWYASELFPHRDQGFGLASNSFSSARLTKRPCVYVRLLSLT